MVTLHKNQTIKSKKTMNRQGCQLIFYVSLFFLAMGFSSVQANPYDSSLINQESEKEVKTYYYRQIDNLQEAVVPRVVHFIHSANYRIYGRLEVQGILFTFKDSHAKNVQLISETNDFKPIAMSRNRYGVWYYVLTLEEYAKNIPQKKIRYKFLADGIFNSDVTHTQQQEDKSGGMISYYYLTDESLKAMEGTILLTKKTSYGQRILFRVYRPDAQSISIAGSFNHWNAELDVMKKNPAGYFELEKTLPTGGHSFIFKVDGKLEFISTNDQIRQHPAYGNVSYFEVP